MRDLFDCGWDEAQAKKKELRPYQADAIHRLKLSLKAKNRRPVLSLPTGGGKTLVAASIISMAREKGRTVAFFVPALSLVDQTVAAFRAEGIDHIGVLQADHPGKDITAPVQVATVQTFGARKTTGGKLPDFDFGIVDECHVRSKALEAEMAATPDKIFVGLSATPWAAGMAKVWDDLVVGTTISDLIAQGYLSTFRAYASAHPDLSGVKTVAGDYHQGQLSEAMGKPGLTADVVETWLKHGENRPTLCFAVDRAHAKKLQQDFAAAGVAAGYVDAFTDSIERDLIRRRFEAGDLKVVCNCRTLTTGVDWAVGCIIDAAPTRSKMLHVQKIGRGLRVNAGIEDLCIAEGEMVLTDEGLVPIQHVTTGMKVWDGVEFVSHDGVVCRGEKEVITHAGLTATADHEVWTAHGKFEQLGLCAKQGTPIAVTGDGGKPVREGEGRFRSGGTAGQGRPRSRGSRVSGLWRAFVERVHELASRHGGLPQMRPATWAADTEVAAGALCGRSGQMHEPVEPQVRGLWRERDRVSFQVAHRDGGLDRREPWLGARHADRPHKQSWALRAGQSALGYGVGKSAEHPKARARVYDILNCGPRHRFTVSGLLVSNCILDHADNSLRLGLVTDIRQERLSDGTRGEAKAREKADPLPKECGKCGFLKAPKVHVCPSCGFAPEKRSAIETEAGELVEITGRKAPAATRHDKQRLWSELLAVAQRRGRSRGWCSHAYRERVGVWPKGLADTPSDPSPETLAWVKAKDIRFAKSREVRA